MENGKKILFVDDDETFREMLCDRIDLYEEFTSVQAANGMEALEKTKADNFDVIVLDVGLPDLDGREICRLMRQKGVSAPIIMLTGADTEADTILGLDAGANDYVTKPFSLEVLLARIRAASN
ncbi:MAG: response regulator transcription factor [Alphaproteobacteria bacterium]|jgi:DNA-binding response OmpR family regulator|nr:response regulator transcription factor [Alphaproteobacteria bacterium]